MDEAPLSYMHRRCMAGEETHRCTDPWAHEAGQGILTLTRGRMRLGRVYMWCTCGRTRLGRVSQVYRSVGA